MDIAYPALYIWVYIMDIAYPALYIWVYNDPLYRRNIAYRRYWAWRSNLIHTASPWGEVTIACPWIMIHGHPTWDLPFYSSLCFLALVFLLSLLLSSCVRNSNNNGRPNASMHARLCWATSRLMLPSPYLPWGMEFITEHK